MNGTAKPLPRQQRIALVLQGGGALGAYQAGVFQALDEHGYCPDWVVGTSIGAINAAIIAGNPAVERLRRLRQFWEGVKHPDFFPPAQLPRLAPRANTRIATIDAAMRGIPGFFTPRWGNPFAIGLPVEPEVASFYDTQELAATLAKLIDFRQLTAADATRLTVSAMRVVSGEMANFDSARQRLELPHVMASCALPPGFPPVRIDGELYWDGGLYSNTPLETVLDDEPRVDTLCFMVDLWRAEGEEPRTFEQVETRQKDVTYASRSKRHIEAYRRMHDLRNAVRALHQRLPPETRHLPEMKELAGLGCHTTMHIVRLRYGGHDWYMAAKDANFSAGSIDWRWQLGYKDACRAVAEAGWLAPQPPHIGVVVHEPQPSEEPD
jgi:NTE family protein